ncbi:MAG: type II secretion system protein M [Eubacterium sp.]|nr:type II secretion system protein M [Eubacterium sp.]
MTDTAKKVLLIIAGLLVCALTYFFVFQPNSDETERLENETMQLQSEVNRLTSLQVQIAELEPQAQMHENEMNLYFAEYPSQMTEQKAIYNVWRMMCDTGMRVTTIAPSKDMTFMENGQIVSMETAVVSENAEASSEATEVAQSSPETKVPVKEIIGKYATYQLAFTGKKSEIYDALDWISNNSEHMAVGPIALSYDASTGKLSGTISVNYYSMNGNGIAYVDPDTSEIVIGPDDIFGTGEKKAKDSKRTYVDPNSPVTKKNQNDAENTESAN